MTRPTYLIVGGGIVGSSIAYHLSRTTDAEILVFERGDELAGETTARSSAGVRLFGDPELLPMKQYGLSMYNRFLASARDDPWFQYTGRTVVATTDRGATVLRDRVADESDARSIRTAAEFFTGHEFERTVVLPELRTEHVKGIEYRPHVGYFDSRGLAAEFERRAVENGVRYRTGVRVTDVRTEAGRATGVIAGDEVVDADEVVCAAGPWNHSLAQSVGIDLPIRHTPVSLLSLEPTSPIRRSPWKVKHRETGTFFRGNHDRTVLAYHMGTTPERYYEEGEVHDPDEVTNGAVSGAVRSQLTAVVDDLLPVLSDATVLDSARAVISRTPDGKPIVGRTAIENFSIAALDAEGIQLAPAIGDILARQLVNDDPTEFYETVSIRRFEGHEDTFGRDD